MNEQDEVTPMAASPVAASGPRRGEVLVERYEIQDLVARTVLTQEYRALDQESETPVLLRMVDPSLLRDEATADEVTARLQRAVGIGGSFLPGLLEADREGSRVLVVEPWPDGVSLREVLLQRESRGQTMRLAEVLPVLVRMQAAFDAIPSPMWHGDVRVEQLWIAPDRMQLTGPFLLPTLPPERVAEAIRSDRLLSRVTAPELLRGESAGRVTDCYGAACIAFEALVGRLPDPGDHPPRELGPVASALSELLVSDPQRRATSLAGLIDAVACLAGLPIPELDPGAFQRPRKAPPDPLSLKTELPEIALDAVDDDEEEVDTLVRPESASEPQAEDDADEVTRPRAEAADPSNEPATDPRDATRRVVAPTSEGDDDAAPWEGNVPAQMLDVPAEMAGPDYEDMAATSPQGRRRIRIGAGRVPAGHEPSDTPQSADAASLLPAESIPEGTKELPLDALLDVQPAHQTQELPLDALLDVQPAHQTQELPLDALLDVQPAPLGTQQLPVDSIIEARPAQTAREPSFDSMVDPDPAPAQLSPNGIMDAQPAPDGTQQLPLDSIIEVSSAEVGFDPIPRSELPYAAFEDGGERRSAEGTQELEPSQILETELDAGAQVSPDRGNGIPGASPESTQELAEDELLLVEQAAHGAFSPQSDSSDAYSIGGPIPAEASHAPGPGGGGAPMVSPEPWTSPGHVDNWTPAADPGYGAGSGHGAGPGYEANWAPEAPGAHPALGGDARLVDEGMAPRSYQAGNAAGPLPAQPSIGSLATDGPAQDASLEPSAPDPMHRRLLAVAILLCALVLAAIIVGAGVWVKGEWQRVERERRLQERYELLQRQVPTPD